MSLRQSLSLAAAQPRRRSSTPGDAQRALGRPREAVNLYQWALQIEPQRREALNNLGNAFLDLRQPAQAAACYQRALALKPDDAGGAVQLRQCAAAARQAGARPRRAPAHAITLAPRDWPWRTTTSACAGRAGRARRGDRQLPRGAEAATRATSRRSSTSATRCASRASAARPSPSTSRPCSWIRAARMRTAISATRCSRSRRIVEAVASFRSALSRAARLRARAPGPRGRAARAGTVRRGAGELRGGARDRPGQPARRCSCSVSCMPTAGSLRRPQSCGSARSRCIRSSRPPTPASPPTGA